MVRLIPVINLRVLKLIPSMTQPAQHRVTGVIDFMITGV